MMEEGVVKFRARHETRRLDPNRFGDLSCKLVAWREILALTGLVGQDPSRYGGAGYGNISARIGPPSSGRGRRAFLITGTQTSGKRFLGLDDLAVIESYDFDRNLVVSRGQARPSSESMTHGALYDVGPQIRWVLHAHSPVLWRNALALRLPTTNPAVSYGTPEMAREVQRLYGASGLAEKRILAMGGHEDGVVVFGHSVEEAGQVLVTWLARAYETVCSFDARGSVRSSRVEP